MRVRWGGEEHRHTIRKKTHSLWSITLSKISKISANRCHILRLKCTKFDFYWGSAPDGAGGAFYCAPPNPYLYLRALVLREGWKGRDVMEKGGRKGDGRGGKRKGRESEVEFHQLFNSTLTGCT